MPVILLIVGLALVARLGVRRRGAFLRFLDEAAPNRRSLEVSHENSRYLR
jgi:hypothetical protein